MRVYRPLLCWYVGLFDKQHIANSGFKQLPPVGLRDRVHGAPDIPGFLLVGKIISGNIEDALLTAGINLNSGLRVLDFGCGCGRTIMWYADLKSQFSGTDIDDDAISWCKNNLDFAEFTVNNPLPPTEYKDNSFDIIYAISVFTHLNLDRRNLWLEELKRILDTSGILIVSIHGKESWKDLGKKDIDDLIKCRFIFRSWEKPGIFPSWYQSMYETKDYAIESFGRFFSILNYIERGVNNHQDLIVLKKK